MADAEKTERATSKKRGDERKKGNVAKSRDIVTLISLLLGFFLIAQLFGYMRAQCEEFYAYIMNLAGNTAEIADLNRGILWRKTVTTVAAACGPLLVAMVLVAIIANGVQTKFIFSLELIKFKLNKIDPIAGVKRMFSVQQLVEALKSIVKIAVIFFLIYSSIYKVLVIAPDILNTALDEALHFMKDEISRMIYIVCLIFAAISIIDVIYQRYNYEKKIKMSKQEVKDEFKQMEGDPKIKSKRRQKQMELSMNRMMQEIPNADVVVRNPTHFAIALKYDIDKDPAPLVLAKGQDLVAKRIVMIAEENKILITEDPPLARSLYAATEVGQYVPPEFFHAVANVMAWVYAQQKRDIKRPDSSPGE